MMMPISEKKINLWKKTRKTINYFTLLDVVTSLQQECHMVKKNGEASRNV